jgi:hypothetical protein
METEIDFQPYLQSISQHYAQWWRLYTLTDAETKAKRSQLPEAWKSPFDFGLMVRSVQRDHLGRRFWGRSPTIKETLGLRWW